MKKLLVASILAVGMGAASAHGYYHGGGYRGSHGGNWVAPLVGGLILGGIIGSAVSQPYYAPPAPPVYYSPAPVYVRPGQYTTCQNYPIYVNGYFTGNYQRVCQTY